MNNKKQAWASAHSQLWTSPVRRSNGSRTQSEVSSIASPNRDRSLLDDVENFDHTNDASALSGSHLLGNRPKEKTLVQVSDILESYGVIAKESDIPAVLLSVVKELEETKRENNFRDLLLREYGDAVRRRFCLYGEDSPPSVAEVSRRLRNESSANPAAGPAPVWLEEQLNDLRRLLQKEAQSCFGEEIDFSLPMLLPDAGHTKSNISQVLQKCREVLARLSSEYKGAKRIIVEKLDQVEPPEKRRSTFTLAEALAELDSSQLLGGRGVAGALAPECEKGHTFKTTLQSIIDTVPASLQIHFQLQVHDAPVLNQCNNLKLLLKFLLSEYLSTERYMEEVEKQRLKLVHVFRFPSTECEEVATDDKAQLDDALTRSLEALKKTVTAVITFPHQISEAEIALRRASTEAVEELAQLLVESRHAGSVAGTSVSSGASGGSSMVRIEPPTRDLSEMVSMVKSRFATLLAQQQRKELVGAHSRVGLAHMEEAMRGVGKQILQQLREICATQDETPGAEQLEALSELMGSVDAERNLTPTRLDWFLNDVMERVRMVKTKYQRALNAASSNKTRADAAAQKCAAAQKKLHKVALCVERIGKDGLGLTFPSQLSSSNVDADDATVRGGGAAAENEGDRGDSVSILRRLNLRPTADAGSPAGAGAGREAAPSATAAAVTEGNVLEALQFLATRVGVDGALRDRVQLGEEMEELRSSQARWKADTTAFHEAMSMLMHRLAGNGQLVKQSLFMMGTDESPKDELVEEVLQRGEGKAATAVEVEYVERSLAELLQKYTRWAQRLQQTTEDHLYTQRKIVKYFAAVRRFFAAQPGKDAALPEDIPDDNLYDIDSCLMRAADVILPALDAAIQGVEEQRSAATAAAAASSSSPPVSPSTTVKEGQATQRQDAITQLVRNSAAAVAGGVLPYDHRIARLYEMVARLYTAVTSLLQVHYLCIPTAAKRRSTGDVELVFDGDSEEDGFVDIDLDRLMRVSQYRFGAEGESFAREGTQNGSGGTNTPSPSTVAANNDVLLRVTYQNIEVLQDTLKRFSANHKMAAIVLQKDMDAVQQQLASMLEKYSEVDLEVAFNQSRDELHELYVTMRDRARVQKGCYFFNRVGGEGSCAWVTALEQLGEGFRGVVDRLVQRTAQAAADRELTDEVVDVCAMYVNWAEHRPLPPSHALPPELLALCVRDGQETKEATAAAAVGGAQTPPPLPSPTAAPTAAPAAAATATAAQRPPKPNNTPSLTPRDSIKQQQQQQQATAQEGHGAVVDDEATGPKVSCFAEDRAVLKVMEHMFQLAQYATEMVNAPTPTAAAAETTAHRLTEELSLLREAVAVAERHVDELTEERLTVERQRDQAQSEAAVARAELRRWKRLQQQQQRQRLQDTEPATPRRLLDAESGRAPAGTSPSRTPQPSSASDAISGKAAMDDATVREVMAYMKLLHEELQAAKQRAGAGVRREEHRLEEGGDDLVRSPPYPVGLGGGEQGKALYRDETAHTRLPPPQQPNRYTALAEELRHRYGSSALAPMVVVDPQTHYGAHRSSAPAQRRYSPVKFHRPAYDACDRYYSRELAGRGEGERGEERVQPQGSNSSSTGGGGGGAPFREEGAAHHDRYFGAGIGRRAAAAPQQRYPRSLSRDKPLRTPAAGAAGFDTPPARVYHAPQRATPVTSPARVSPSAGRSRCRSPSAMAGRANTVPGNGGFGGRRNDEDGAEGAEAFYDDADWRVPSQAHRRRSSSSAQRRTAGSNVDLSVNLAAAVQQIEAATQQGRMTPTPTRHSTRAPLPTRDNAPAPPLTTPEKMNRNANLRATALRRLAEVVSRTKVVTPPRGARL
ncbi:hypothetical protein ABB37_09923 [Leptomonas pyrrhocoris]|uniref:Uncharacterized protein n=1 Tax=Leptomonas pyrrhocoris TaxID=157538 RepID=A0A0N0VCQ4_LEPPY|nr:hypothetical protein ABB37_09923 [Leptomonas pyrrhocoris]KPA73371.1 hypothetical protein ABB37_09923 [Leptomonas pyrrhocoris]|eukprot:XP_015651810.1 hypothetical protein ABB37_09923 [Leptomonas pyrrhocoris]